MAFKGRGGIDFGPARGGRIDRDVTRKQMEAGTDAPVPGGEFLNPEEAPAPAASYSNLAILPPGKRILVIAGQIGNLIDGSMVEGLEAQYEQTLKNIHALVTSQGGSKHDIARITVFLTEEPSDWSKIKDANEKYLNQPPPAKTWI